MVILVRIFRKGFFEIFFIRFEMCSFLVIFFSYYIGFLLMGWEGVGVEVLRSFLVLVFW